MKIWFVILGLVVTAAVAIFSFIILKPTIIDYKTGATKDEQSYTGTIEQIGVSIYMQGTHFLYKNTDGSILLLESKTINLDMYVGKKVTVSGLLNEAVEGGGQIMTVETIQLVGQ